MEEAQKLLADLLLQVADNKIFFLQQKHFDQGESSGHLLATNLRSQQSSYITKLISASGIQVEEGKDILKVLHTYYDNLYASKFSGSTEELTNYLTNIPLATLSDSYRQLLEQPISCFELEESLQFAPNDKAPGVDGLPAEFYKLYKEILLPRLLEALDMGPLPMSMR